MCAMYWWSETYNLLQTVSQQSVLTNSFSIFFHMFSHCWSFLCPIAQELPRLRLSAFVLWKALPCRESLGLVSLWLLALHFPQPVCSVGPGPSWIFPSSHVCIANNIYIYHHIILYLYIYSISYQLCIYKYICYYVCIYIYIIYSLFCV